MNNLTICSLISKSVEKFGGNIALSFAGKKGLTYSELSDEILYTSDLLKSFGIQKNDKVALIGENMPNWGIAYLSVLFAGATTVPVLPEFHVSEIMSILSHSESKLLFVSLKQHNRMREELARCDLPVIIIDEISTAGTKAHQQAGASLETLKEKATLVREDDLASLIYTSGTTGSSKGVMLTHHNLAWMVQQSLTIQDVRQTDRFLSILPMSHAYENSLGFLLALQNGAGIYYLDKQPTPTVLVNALKIVRPTFILSVPLIIEKLYRKQVLPKLTGNVITRALFRYPPARKLLNRMAGIKLMKTFGGELRFFGIGGSKLDPVIEQYLREARFPYAIGYGLTETSPLLAGSSPAVTRWQSTGKALQGTRLRINDPNPKTGEGEIQAKGPNVMKGYYKNPEATKNAFTDDGWFRTGDLAIIDEEGFVYIRGRIKNVILGTNGENIYPEEIEAIFNSIEGIEESLVVQKQGKLVAMVNLNILELEEKMITLNERLIRVTNETIDEALLEIQSFVNQRVNRFSRVNAVVLHPLPFEKTPTNKIKRYLYGE